MQKLFCNIHTFKLLNYLYIKQDRKIAQYGPYWITLICLNICQDTNLHDNAKTCNTCIRLKYLFGIQQTYLF